MLPPLHFPGHRLLFPCPAAAHASLFPAFPGTSSSAATIALCFHGEDGCQFYLRYLTEFAVKFGCLIHAYMLMTNCVHLLPTPAKAESAGMMMKHRGQRYVQYIDCTYRG